MKIKKSLDKKLVLNKKTISHLKEKEKSLLFGGVDETLELTVCITNCKTTCPGCPTWIRCPL